MAANSARQPNAHLIEQVVAALDDGVPASVDALARVVHASEAELRAALDAIAAYDERVAAERPLQPTPTPPTPTDALPPGTRIGPYVIESVLGQGGMGIVYRARQTTLGDRLVALKVLPASLADRDPRFVDRFRREATLAAAIHHPNLAEVYGFEADLDTLCFAMRLVEGPTLHDVLVDLARRHQGPIRPTSQEHVRRCVLLARSIANALAEVHARGLVHRDVKPSNVLLERADGDAEAALLAPPVLVDFGLLRPAGDTTLTGTATLIGTPAYSSHDSLLGRELDARADVFSLAATLHDLLTCTSPETRAPATAGLPDVRAINPTVDPRLAAILTMALQERKELRYEHGGALRDELDRWLRGEPLRAAPMHAVGRLRLWARRNPVRAAWVGAAALVAMMLVTAVGTWLTWSAAALTASARTAAAREEAGDLAGAAEACRELLQGGPVVPLLWWLRDDIDKAHRYWSTDGPLHSVAKHLLASEAAERSGGFGARDAVLERQRANFRLVELLLDERHAALVEPIGRYFVREASGSSAPARRVASLDALTDYLVVQDLPQHVPVGLLELLRETLLGPDAAMLSADLRTAAIAAITAIRSVEAFASTVDVLQSDLAREDAQIATAGSHYTYMWLHFDSRAALPTVGRDLHDRIGKELLERWAIGYSRQDERHVLGENSVARHIAWWEEDPEGAQPPRPHLDLPTMRTQVDAMHAQLASEWQQGRDSILNAPSNTRGHPYERYLQTSGRIVQTFETGCWQPAADDDVDIDLAAADADRFADRGAVRFGKGRVVTLSGTVGRASRRAGELEDWDDGFRDGFLKLRRPGHSLLRIRSCVPRDAHALRIVVTQMTGRRGIVRSGGLVEFRLQLADLPWQVESIACDHRRRQSRQEHARPTDWEAGITTTYHVPQYVLGDRTEIEILFEYLHGNTTWRILGVELLWNPPEPR